MIQIPCPWCGRRDEQEFSYFGEEDVTRPKDPASVSDATWAEYLYFRNNPRGPIKELWLHSAGCRSWFTISRDTVTNEIITEGRD